MTSLLKAESDKISNLYQKAIDPNGGAGTGTLVAFKKLLREVPLPEVNGLTEFDATKAEAKTEELCEKLLKAYLPKLSLFEDDLTRARDTATTIIKVIITDVLMTPAGKMDWKQLEKAIDVDLNVRDAMVNSFPSGGADVRMT